MFPEKWTASCSEIRFKGFTDPWEQRNANEELELRSEEWYIASIGDIVSIGNEDYNIFRMGTIPVYGTGGYMLSVNDALSYDRDAIGIGRKGTIDRPYILKSPILDSRYAVLLPFRKGKS